jgi:CheY-like chemotaxis protein
MSIMQSTKQIRAYEKSKGLPACKIIGLSGGFLKQLWFWDGDAKTKQACLTSGMNDLVLKPVKKDELSKYLWTTENYYHYH